MIDVVAFWSHGKAAVGGYLMSNEGVFHSETGGLIFLIFKKGVF